MTLGIALQRSALFSLLLFAIFRVCARADEPNASAVSFATASDPMTLELDARDASRGLMFAHLTIPVRPGPFTLVYPKWIPGEHTPSGPLNDVAELHLSANGATIPWSRDLVDMYSFHTLVPGGVAQLNVDFDVLLNAPGDQMSTNHIAVVRWNRDLLYQQNTDASTVFVKPSILLPSGWDFGTALSVAQRSGNRIDFAPITLSTLVDSPLDCGLYVKHVRLWSNGSSIVQLDIFADSPENLDVTSEQITPYRRLVPETLAMYGARHWNNYDALLVVSDAISHDGIEHHESSDNRASSDFLSSEQERLSEGDLIPHELSHSWNGKYRRPDDLTTANFQIPMRTDLLWVYEGMNQYLGDVLSFRTGLRDRKVFPDLIASYYASLDAEPGRMQDPLIDTTAAAPYLYVTSGEYRSLRRSAGDFYTEGELLWLDVDTIIREQSGGVKSLDDFLRAFAGPPNTGPEVVTYTRDDVERLLHGITPYDWHDFFERYVYKVAVHPPSDELARAGFRLVYTAEPNLVDAANDEADHRINLWYSMGARLDSDGAVTDVRESSPAWKTGLAPGMKVIAVNQRAFTADVLNRALKAGEHTTTPMAFLVNDQGWYRTYGIDYHGGPRYAHLVRIPGKPDMLAKIIAPRLPSH